MKNLALSLFVFLSTLAFGQEIPYSFSYSSGGFEYLVDPIPLSSEEVWSIHFGSSLLLDIDFRIAGELCDRLNIGSGVVDIIPVESEQFVRFNSFFKLLQDRGTDSSLSSISYKIETSLIDDGRVLKIEWRNAGIPAGPSFDFIPEDFVDIQVWLHENSNEISLHFGPSHISMGSPLFSLVTASVTGIKLLYGNVFIGPVGDGTMPDSVVDYCEPGLCYQNISSHPEEGTIYWFTPIPIMVNTTDVEALVNMSVSPNPTTDIFNVSLAPEQLSEITMLRLVNLVGETIWEATNSSLSSSMTVDVKGFPAGIYTLIIDHAEGVIAKKVVKK